MNRNIPSIIVRLLVLSLVVGVLLSVFDIRPEKLLTDFGETAVRIFEVLVDAIKWAVPYVLLGAVVVVPLWIVYALIQAARRRRK